MSKKVPLKFNFDQICMLRAVMYEYYSENECYDDAEEKTRVSLEELLAAAEHWFS